MRKSTMFAIFSSVTLILFSSLQFYFRNNPQSFLWSFKPIGGEILMTSVYLGLALGFLVLLFAKVGKKIGGALMVSIGVLAIVFLPEFLSLGTFWMIAAGIFALREGVRTVSPAPGPCPG